MGGFFHVFGWIVAGLGCAGALAILGLSSSYGAYDVSLVGRLISTFPGLAVSATGLFFVAAGAVIDRLDDVVREIRLLRIEADAR